MWRKPVVQEAIRDSGEGRGSLSKQVGKSYSADGVHLCTVETYDCCIYDGGFGGERPPKDVVEYPDREPDLAYEEVCGYDSHLPAHGRLAPAAHQLGPHRADRAGAPHQPRCLHGRHRHAPPHRAAHPRAARAPAPLQVPLHFSGAAGHAPLHPGVEDGRGRGPLPRGGRGRWGGPAVSELLPRRVGIRGARHGERCEGGRSGGEPAGNRCGEGDQRRYGPQGASNGGKRRWTMWP